MTEQQLKQLKQLKQLGETLWDIANQLRGVMNPDQFRDYMLSFLFLRYLSGNYEASAKKELGRDYPKLSADDKRSPLTDFYAGISEKDQNEFERHMRNKVHYAIKPEFLWDSIVHLAQQQSDDLLTDLENGFKFVENESFGATFQGLFSEINLNSEKLGKTRKDRNKKLCEIIKEISKGLPDFSVESDVLGDAYEYLIGQFAAGSGQKAGEFYTPQQISTILSEIVTLDSHDPSTGHKEKLDKVLDFTCGSGSLLLNVRNQMRKRTAKTKLDHRIGKIYGQEKNITTFNLARMNMLLHGVKDTEFEIHHGDTLTNDWGMLNEMNPAKKTEFDAIVANPPFSYRWQPKEETAKDFRFQNHGVAPKSAADFAFLLHGFHFLREDGTMAIILPHGVLFRGGAEEKIRKKLLQDGHIDTVIGLPSNLFFSTSIPVCILVLKKCKKPDDVLFINASEHFEKGKRQNKLRDGDVEHGEPNDIQKIIETYKYRTEESRYSRCVSMAEIEKKDFNLNLSRYVSTAKEDEKIVLANVNASLVDIEKDILDATTEHNKFLKELGLPLLPL